MVQNTKRSKLEARSRALPGTDERRQMRAVLINNPGEAPTLGEFREPAAQDGAVLINVETAALGGWDGYALTRPHAAYPLVLMGEGVGRTEDGRRVYFGERSVAPFGAW